MSRLSYDLRNNGWGMEAHVAPVPTGHIIVNIHGASGTGSTRAFDTEAAAFAYALTVLGMNAHWFRAIEVLRRMRRTMADGTMQADEIDALLAMAEER